MVSYNYLDQLYWLKCKRIMLKKIIIIKEREKKKRDNNCRYPNRESSKQNSY